MQTPPGPKGFPLIGVIPSLIKHGADYLKATFEQYGDVAEFNPERLEKDVKDIDSIWSQAKVRQNFPKNRHSQTERPGLINTSSLIAVN